MNTNVTKTIKTAQRVLRNPSAYTLQAKENLANELEAIISKSEKDKEPWWVIALKVLAYAIGLILAGIGTTTTATILFPILK